MKTGGGVILATLLFAAILASSVPASASAAAAANEDEVGFPPVESMSLKTIRRMLDDRGVKCKGCVEKGDFAERLKETIHLPLKQPEPVAKPRGGSGGVGGGGGGGDGSVGGMSKEDQRKLMEMMGKVV